MRHTFARLALTSLLGSMAGIALAMKPIVASAQTRPDTANASDSLEQSLAEEARLDWIVQAALTRNPALRSARARVRAAHERTAASARLPDLELKYEQWGVPLGKPYALNRADSLMLGLRQAIPAPGTRDASARMAAADADISTDEGQALERELVTRVRRAYFEYYAADQALKLHDEHVATAEQIVAQLRSDYQAGRGTQQDILKMLVELSRLHNDLTEVRQQREASRFLLNHLMARKPDAALGAPTEIDDGGSDLDLTVLAQSLNSGRPDVSAAQRAVARSQAALELAQHAARRPSFMVGADYWYMPTLDSPNAYGAMVSMTLPWLNPRHREQVREAEHELNAQQLSAQATREVASYEFHEAASRLQAATQSLQIIERDLLPEVRRSLEAARTGFAVGQRDLVTLLDAMRSYFEVQLEHSYARSRLLTQRADLERVAGARLVPGLKKGSAHD